MLGWGSWLDREVAFSSGGGGGGSNSSGFSSRVTLPLARRGQRESPTTVHLSVSANGAYNSGNGSNSVPAVYPSVRKRPVTEPLVLRRLMIDEERNDDEDDAVDGVAMSDNDGQQPLDLTLPKLKVRQHWSGGCIVQVNDRAETATQQRCSPSDATRLDYCCAVDCAPADSDHQLIIRLEASSVVRGHHHGKSPRSAGSAAAANAAKPSDPRRPDAVASDDSEPRPRHQGPSHSHPAAQPSPQSSAVQCGLNAVVPDKFVQFLWACEHRSTPLATPVFNDPVESFPRADAAAPALAMGDDLRRLTRSLQHLHLSGYYYGNLSWKDSTQLLQGTSVGTFLVRDSSDPRYLYALSIQTERGPTSVRIHYSDGSFRLDAEAVLSQRLPRFCSINDLVDHYVLQWKHCRQKGQVWLDDTGQVHSNVVLDKALPRQTPSLQHLCRLSWNRLPSETKLHWSLSGSIPQRVQSFLREYPFQY